MLENVSMGASESDADAEFSICRFGLAGKDSMWSLNHANDNRPSSMNELESRKPLNSEHIDSFSMIDANSLADLVGRSIASSDSSEMKRAKLLQDASELLGADGWAVLSAPGERRSLGTSQGCTVKIASRLFSQQSFPDLLTSFPKLVLWSRRTIANGETVFVCLLREAGRDPFSARENRLFKIIAEEISWLHDESPPPASSLPIPEMAPRRRLVFDLLRMGFDRKAIADQLAISPNTVGEHQKAIYRQLQVNTQVSLMRNFRYP